LPKSIEPGAITSLDSRLVSLETLVQNIGGIDLKRWSIIETKLEQLELSLRNIRPPVEKPKADPDAPMLLTSAAYGPPDNLKRISGVGPVLESLLNTLGVWYFWQVALWSDREVAYVDSQLEVFKGRILRDSWVSQAKRLAKTSDNRPPAHAGHQQGLGITRPDTRPPA
ncbi:MAG: hypothetical protein AAFV29_19780, partial [Myxococcota bacterium]